MIQNGKSYILVSGVIEFFPGMKVTYTYVYVFQTCENQTSTSFEKVDIKKVPVIRYLRGERFLCMNVQMIASVTSL